jgi:hypothetical protein
LVHSVAAGALAGVKLTANIPTQTVTARSALRREDLDRTLPDRITPSTSSSYVADEFAEKRFPRGKRHTSDRLGQPLSAGPRFDARTLRRATSSWSGPPSPYPGFSAARRGHTAPTRRWEVWLTAQLVGALFAHARGSRRYQRLEGASAAS